MCIEKMCKSLGPVRVRRSKYPLLLLLFLYRPTDRTTGNECALGFEGLSQVDSLV